MLVYAPLKNRFGLTNIKVGYTAGEAIGPEIFRFYRSIGVNLKQLYGQTEASVYVTMQPDGEIRADTVGRPAPQVEISIDDNGEVLYRSPGVFLGYYKDPEKTAETKTADGFVRSGDAGFFDQTGHLKIIDRAKDVGRMRDGALFPPKYVENKLKFYPNIKEAVAFGAGKDSVACFINIDLVAVGNWAERNGVTYGSYQELAGHPLVYDMIEKHVDEVNRSLAQEPRMGGAQVRRFLILPKELEADDGELTRTQKVRRGFIGERYATARQGALRRLGGGRHPHRGDLRGRTQGRHRGAGEDSRHEDLSGRSAGAGAGGVSVPSGAELQRRRRSAVSLPSGEGRGGVSRVSAIRLRGSVRGHGAGSRFAAVPTPAPPLRGGRLAGTP